MYFDYVEPLRKMSIEKKRVMTLLVLIPVVDFHVTLGLVLLGFGVSSGVIFLASKDEGWNSTSNVLIFLVSS